LRYMRCWLVGVSIETGRYKPHPNRRVDIPKEQGKFRTLQIPCIRDRVVFVMNPNFSDGLSAEKVNSQPCSIIPNAFQYEVPFSSAKGTNSFRSAFAAA
jgi:hypothetical protein